MRIIGVGGHTMRRIGTLAAVLTCLVVGLAGCGSNGDGTAATGQGPAVTADSSPAQVVTAFVNGWSRDDQRAMRDLSTDAFWDDFSQSLSGSTTFSDLRITGSTALPSDDPRRSEEAKGYAEVVYVLLDAEIRQRPVATWTDGRHPWGFYVVRDSDDQPWLVGSSGLG